MNKTLLAQRLKKMRLGSGFTQMQTAQKLGISNTALSQYESGKRTPSLEVLRSLAELYGVTMDRLVLNSGPEEASLSAAEIIRLAELKEQSPELVNALCRAKELDPNTLRALLCILNGLLPQEQHVANTAQ
ncbi:MAG: helix-turn-helix transcriptional regulator [Bacillota bacterium]